MHVNSDKDDNKNLKTVAKLVTVHKVFRCKSLRGAGHDSRDAPAMRPRLDKPITRPWEASNGDRSQLSDYSKSLASSLVKFL